MKARHEVGSRASRLPSAAQRNERGRCRELQGQRKSGVLPPQLIGLCPHGVVARSTGVWPKIRGRYIANCPSCRIGLVIAVDIFINCWSRASTMGHSPLSMAKSCLRGNGGESRRLICGRAASLEGRPATESGVDTSLVVTGGETIQLAMEVDAIPEECPVEILAPKGSDKALYKRVRARHEGEVLSSSMSSTLRFARQR